ncbi:MAG: Ig-like domain-containing protein, partial [Spirochaetia bacterium]|nr:Ig-like domain-containing protein [Spirochaetia bacterium]
ASWPGIPAFFYLTNGTEKGALESAFLLLGLGGGSGGGGGGGGGDDGPATQWIIVTPDTPEVPNGNDIQMKAVLVENTGATTDVTHDAGTAWNLTGAGGASSVNSTGLVSVAGETAGTDMSVSASYTGLSGNTTVTATSAVLSRVEINKSSLNLAYDASYTATEQLTLKAVFTDGSEFDVTEAASWSLAHVSGLNPNTSVGNVAGATDNTKKGIVSSLNADGTNDEVSQVTATYGGQNATSDISVTACTVNTVTVSPLTADTPSIAVGIGIQYTATAAFTGGCPSADVTNLATWASSDPDTATINSSGLAIGVAGGTTNITATYGGTSSGAATSQLTVNASLTLDSITVTPAGNTLEYPQTQQYTATGTYSDSSTQNLTGLAAWSSSNTSAAIVSNEAGSRGLVSTKKNPGSSTILAQYGGVSGSTSLIVTSDTTAPYMLTAVSDTATTVIVAYSENMLQDADGIAPWDAGAADDPTQYTLTEEPYGSDCAAITTHNPTSVTKIDGRTYRLNFGVALCSNDLFRITNTTVTDKFTNVITDPDFLTFLGLEQFKVVSAISKGLNSIEISFNRDVRTVAGFGSGVCSGTTECSRLYKLSDSDLVVTSASVSGNKVTLTHTGDQSGVSYTVMVANGDTTTAADGFTNAVTEYVESKDIGSPDSVQAAPNDRASFNGSGEAYDKFEDGYYFFDPFVDGTSFSFAFAYAGKVYLGTNDTNTAAFRFEPGGDNAVQVGFDWIPGIQGSMQCPGVKGFGYLDPDYYDGTLSTVHDIDENIGGAGSECTAHADYQHIGGDVEVGVVGFTSGTATISGTNYEILYVGTLKKAASHVYFTQDLDTTLDFNRYAITGTNGVNSKSIQLIYTKDEFAYTGISSSHGTNAPVLNRNTMSASGGVVSMDTVENFIANSIPYIGKSGTPANPNSVGVVGIDSMIIFNNVLYIANNGGVVYSSNHTGSMASVTWTNGTPSSGSWTGNTLYMPDEDLTTNGGGLGKVSPGRKGVPLFMEHSGRLYMARNVSVETNCADGTGDGETCVDPGHGELWVCNPASSGSSTICEQADWTLVLDSSSFGYVNSISLLLENGSNKFYIAFDDFRAGEVDGTNGIKVYSLNSGITHPAGWGDFTLQGPSGSEIGFGSGQNKILFSSAHVAEGLKNYIYITAGNGPDSGTPRAIQVFRQIDF